MPLKYIVLYGDFEWTISWLFSLPFGYDEIKQHGELAMEELPCALHNSHKHFTHVSPKLLKISLEEDDYLARYREGYTGAKQVQAVWHL